MTTATRRFERVFLIYNPFAGKLIRHPGLLEQVRGELEGLYGAVEMAPTTGPGMAGAWARECAERGADLILVLGGDGTLNEVLNGLAGSEVCCGPLPAGTANVLAMETGVGHNVLNAVKALPERVAYAVPLARMIDGAGAARYFLLMAGAGLDAQIVKRVNPRLKEKTGKFAYWVSGFSLLGSRLNEFDVRVNGAMYRASFALASRVKNYGGDMTIARDANLLRPEFEIVLFEGPSTIRYLKYFVGVGTGTTVWMSGVRVLKGTKVEIAGGAVSTPIQVDGESAGDGPVTLEIATERLNLLLPREFVERHAPAKRERAEARPLQ